MPTPEGRLYSKMELTLAGVVVGNSSIGLLDLLQAPYFSTSLPHTSTVFWGVCFLELAQAQLEPKAW